jgi:excisionase family DNA binding protein
MIQTQNFVFMDIKEAAEALGIHPNTLQERAKAGLIPGAKIGKEWRFIDADIADFMRAQYPSNLPATPQPVQKVRKATVKTGTSFEEALNLPRRNAGKA